MINVQNWKDFLTVLLRAGYRNGDMITSKTAILYTYVLWLIGKYDYDVDHDTLREIMAQWFFASVLTGRYTDSPETRMEQDLAHLREVKDAAGFVALWRKMIGDTLTGDFWRTALPGALAVSARGYPPFSPTTRAQSARAAGVVLQGESGRPLHPAAQPKKSALERHHLFPRKYLAKLGVTEQPQQNQLANFALVEWQDNIEISDTAPAIYLPKYLARLSQKLERNSNRRNWRRCTTGMRCWMAGSICRMVNSWKPGGRASQGSFTTPSRFYEPARALNRRVDRRAAGYRHAQQTAQPDDADDGLTPRHIMRREFWQALMQRAAGMVPVPARPGKGINSLIYVPTAEKRRLYWEYWIRMHNSGPDLSVSARRRGE